MGYVLASCACDIQPIAGILSAYDQEIGLHSIPYSVGSGRLGNTMM